MDYTFNGEIAKIYGIPEAVLIHNLYWWIAKNEANGRHYYDGRSWTYNSISAFAKLFVFWEGKEGQVRRIIDKLRDNGVIYVGNYNKKPFDRTQWYALSEDVLAIYRNQQIDLTKASNGNAENVKAFDESGAPIPDSKQSDSKRVGKQPPNPQAKSKQNTLEAMIDGTSLSDNAKSALRKWLEYKKFSYQEMGFKTLLSIAERKVNEYGEAAVVELVDECISNTWKGLIWEKLLKRPAAAQSKRQRNYDEEE